MSAYQIDFEADAAGKRIPSSKRRILFRFGFCPGSEHVVSLSWSPTSGKTILASDGREVHFSPGKGFISMQGKFQTSWESDGNHFLKIVVYAAPPLKKRASFRQFDLFLDGRSFFDLPTIEEFYVDINHEGRGPGDNESIENGRREGDSEAIRIGLTDDVSVDPPAEEDDVPTAEAREERNVHQSFEGVGRKIKNSSKSATHFLSSPIAIAKRKKEASSRSREQLQLTPAGYPPLETTKRGGIESSEEGIRNDKDENLEDTFESKLDVQRKLLELEVREMEQRLQKEKEAARDEISRLRGKISDLEEEVIMKVNDALATSEEEAKALRAKAEDYQNEIQKLRLDGITSREEIGELQGQVAQFETIVRENKDLKRRNEEIVNNASLQQRKLGLAVVASEAEAERLRKSAALAEEEAQRPHSDKAAAEDEIQQLKSRISSLEKELADKSTSRESLPKEKSGLERLHSSECSNKAPSNSDDGSEHVRSTRGVETGSYLVNSKKCCLCCKDATEGMQTCQCGKKSCDKQAHASCLIGSGRAPLPSVSHPCTPAPVLPLILCGGIFDTNT